MLLFFLVKNCSNQIYVYCIIVCGIVSYEIKCMRINMIYILKRSLCFEVVDIIYLMVDGFIKQFIKNIDGFRE